MSANIEYITKAVRRYIEKATGKSNLGMRDSTYLYKIGQKNVRALRMSRQAVIDILNKMACELKVELYPYDEKIKLLKHTDLTILELSKYIKERLDQQGFLMTKKGTVYKPLNNITDSTEHDEVDTPSPEEVPSVDVNADTKSEIIELVDSNEPEKPIKQYMHKSGVKFLVSEPSCTIGAVVSIIDPVGEAYFVTELEEPKENEDPYALTNDISYAKIFDYKVINEAFDVVNGVMHINDSSSDLAYIIDKQIRHTILNKDTCVVKLIPVNRDLVSAQTFEFGPVDPMEEIESRLTPELRNFLREKLNEPR